MSDRERQEAGRASETERTGRGSGAVDEVIGLVTTRPGQASTVLIYVLHDDKLEFLGTQDELRTPAGPPTLFDGSTLHDRLFASFKKARLMPRVNYSDFLHRPIQLPSITVAALTQLSNPPAVRALSDHLVAAASLASGLSPGAGRGPVANEPGLGTTAAGAAQHEDDKRGADDQRTEAAAGTVVRVRRSQVDAARLSVEISEELGEPVSPALRALAEAKPGEEIRLQTSAA